MSADPSTVELPDGRVVQAATQDGGEPDVLSIRRGPYDAYLVLGKTDERIVVQPPIYVNKRRPALFEPEDFFDFSEAVKARSESEIREVI